MNAMESRFYDLGRQARQFNFGREVCNLPRTERVKRGWWLAGWHDEDMNIEVLTRKGWRAA